jgi:thiamine pyrophosphokinase
MMDGICWIFGAAPFSGPLPSIGEGDLVIAADAGYDTLTALGARRIDRVVGDFDSLGRIPAHPHVEAHPPEKDETDMLLAVRTGLALGCRAFRIYGGLGGRLDHSLANLQILIYLTRRGAGGWLIGEGLAVTAIRDGALRFSGGAEGRVSVFAADGAARGVTLEGLKYPLADRTLTADMPLGVSNEFTGSPARIAVRDGALIVVAPERAIKWLISES